jgi:hypothetical protein
MAETYIELTFVTVGPEAHVSAVGQIRGMRQLKVVQDHTRERTWFQRSRLLVPEWECRIVLAVRDPEDELGVRSGDVTDPYRMLDYGGTRTLRVPAGLIELSDSLQGTYASVRAARMRFETRRYEPQVLDDLVAQLEALGQEQAVGTFQRESGKLFARMESRVEFVDDLARYVRRSGLVDADRLRVEYY